MESPMGLRSPDGREERPSRTNRLKSFVRSRTPSPTKTRVAEARQHAVPVQFPASATMSNPFMLPPDHPHAQLAMTNGAINKINSPEREARHTQQRNDSNEGKRRRPISTGMPTPTQPSPPKRRMFDEKFPDKENFIPAVPASPIWSQFTSQQSLLDQGISPQRQRTGVHERSLRSPVASNGKHASDAPASITSTLSGKSLATSSQNDPSQTIQSRSTAGSITSTSSAGARTMNYNTSKLSLVGSQDDPLSKLEGVDFAAAFEAVLVTRNIPEETRQKLRLLDLKVKKEFVRRGATIKAVEELPEQSKSSFWSFGQSKTAKAGRGRSTTRNAQEEEKQDKRSPSKGDMSRGKGMDSKKEDRSPSKKPRSLSRPRSLMSLKNLSSSSLHSLGFDGARESKEQPTAASTGDPRSPQDFVEYLQGTPKPADVEVGKLHKLRVLLRNESIMWIDAFIQQGGLAGLLQLLNSVLKIEWREEHDDLLLREILFCLKGLSTTQPGLDEILKVESTLFPMLLKLLFDEDKKGPSEYNDRKAIVDLLYASLAAAEPAEHVSRARSLLVHLSDPKGVAEETPLEFITQMHQARPYTLWCKEVNNVSKEVFWIFMHHSNIITAANVPEDHRPYYKRHFPPGHAPMAAAPHSGSVECDATKYISAHLGLMNALIALLPTREERNTVRNELKVSGFERMMGNRLRLCRDKYYGIVHESIATWIAAAGEDGWPTANVSRGPPQADTAAASTAAASGAPKLELPKLDLGIDQGKKEDDAWV